jgi:hypothetical protein
MLMDTPYTVVVIVLSLYLPNGLPATPRPYSAVWGSLLIPNDNIRFVKPKAPGITS